MRPIPVLVVIAAVAVAAAAAAAAGHAAHGAVHGPGSAWALFSFAVSAFRAPLR